MVDNMKRHRCLGNVPLWLTVVLDVGVDALRNLIQNDVLFSQTGMLPISIQ